MCKTTIKIKLNHKNSKIPKYSSDHSVGMDLYSTKEFTIEARNRVTHNTHIIVEMPDGHYGRIASRSGLAVKHGIETGAGVIDADYRGELIVLLHNHSNVDYRVKVGDRIAQLIITKVEHPKIEIQENLTKSTRNDRGIGSSGA